MDKYIPESRIERPRDYDVHTLSQDLADALTAKTVVPSRTFKNEISKNIARSMLPNINDEQMQVIVHEIESEPELVLPAADEVPEDEE